MKQKTKIIIVILSVFFIFLWWNSNKDSQKNFRETEELSFSQFKSMLTKEGERKFGKIYTRPTQLKTEKKEPFSILKKKRENLFLLEISESKITGRYIKPGTRIEKKDTQETILARSIPFIIESIPSVLSEDLLEKIEAKNIHYHFLNEKDQGFFSILLSFLPVILIFALIWFLLMRQISTGNKALSFGKSRAVLNDENNKNKTFFKDVAGCQEAIDELVEIVDFLKSPKKFHKIGAKIPKGVLLVGSPGTGKTLLAKAVAGESGVPFYSISGSDFVEMFVGVGASRVRDLFQQAKKNSPCIVFIDEIDAVGRLRGAGLGGGHDEREQTLNQMLVEMDGFSEKEGIIIIAATNRPDVLDPALLRPGRFDRQVMVNLPDLKGREAILKIHSRKVLLEEDVNLEQIARGTPGFTGADLANVINEAALLAARNDKSRVNISDLEEARDKVLMGPERRSFYITPKEKEVIAFHESGHTLLTCLLNHSEPVHKVMIIPRGKALGLTQNLPEEDRYIQPSNYWKDQVCILMGGYLAEEIIFGDTSTGASNDIKVATKIARQMVCEWGMSKKVGTVAYTTSREDVFLGRSLQENTSYSPAMAQIIDEEINRIIKEQKEKGFLLIKENLKVLNKLAQALIDKEIIDAKEVEEIVGKDVFKRKRQAKDKREAALLKMPPAKPALTKMQVAEALNSVKSLKSGKITKVARIKKITKTKKATKTAKTSKIKKKTSAKA